MVVVVWYETTTTESGAMTVSVVTTLSDGKGSTCCRTNHPAIYMLQAHQ